MFSGSLSYLTIGAGMDDLLSLSGRVPLWEALWLRFQEHPLIGHGFGAFWSPQRFDEIYTEVKWRAVVGHNGFLDELLATGTIGLVLFLAFWIAAMWLSLHSTRQHKYAGYLVFSWLLLFLCFNSMGSLMQFYFQMPTLLSMTALFALVAQCRAGAEWRSVAQRARPWQFADLVRNGNPVRA
jgi:exopolysaccharide production protein ExoQ